MRVDGQKGPSLFHSDAQNFKFETRPPTFVSMNYQIDKFNYFLNPRSISFVVSDL